MAEGTSLELYYRLNARKKTLKSLGSSTVSFPHFIIIIRFLHYNKFKITKVQIISKANFYKSLIL